MPTGRGVARERRCGGGARPPQGCGERGGGARRPASRTLAARSRWLGTFAATGEPLAAEGLAPPRRGGCATKAAARARIAPSVRHTPSCRRPRIRRFCAPRRVERRRAHRRRRPPSWRKRTRARRCRPGITKPPGAARRRGRPGRGASARLANDLDDVVARRRRRASVVARLRVPRPGVGQHHRTRERRAPSARRSPGRMSSPPTVGRNAAERVPLAAHRVVVRGFPRPRSRAAVVWQNDAPSISSSWRRAPCIGSRVWDMTRELCLESLQTQSLERLPCGGGRAAHGGARRMLRGDHLSGAGRLASASRGARGHHRGERWEPA